MADKSLFDEEALAFLEQKLWRIIEKRTFDNELPPHISSLLITDACEDYQIPLTQYAWDIVHEQSDKWAQHPLLEHLAQCDVCQMELQKMRDFYERSPNIQRLSDTDIDITIFYKDMFPPNEAISRSELPTEEFILLDAGLLDDPEGWYYSLEQIRGKEDEHRGILLTITTPEGSASEIPVSIVLLGRILQRRTDDKGQIFFAGVEAPFLNRDATPAIVLRINRPS